jgi:hypothetical protein
LPSTALAENYNVMKIAAVSPWFKNSEFRISNIEIERERI